MTEAAHFYTQELLHARNIVISTEAARLLRGAVERPLYWPLLLLLLLPLLLLLLFWLSFRSAAEESASPTTTASS